MLWVLEWVAGYETASWAKVLAYLSVITHFESFSQRRPGFQGRHFLCVSDFPGAVSDVALPGIAAVEVVSEYRVAQGSDKPSTPRTRPFTFWSFWQCWRSRISWRIATTSPTTRPPTNATRSPTRPRRSFSDLKQDVTIQYFDKPSGMQAGKDLLDRYAEPLAQGACRVHRLSEEAHAWRRAANLTHEGDGHYQTGRQERGSENLR